MIRALAGELDESGARVRHEIPEAGVRSRSEVDVNRRDVGLNIRCKDNFGD